MIPVVSLTRECQYVWNSDYGRVRCGRLAYWYYCRRVGTSLQLAFRCNDSAHDDGQFVEIVYDHIHEGETFGLGYKP